MTRRILTTSGLFGFVLLTAALAGACQADAVPSGGMPETPEKPRHTPVTKPASDPDPGDPNAPPAGDGGIIADSGAPGEGGTSAEAGPPTPSFNPTTKPAVAAALAAAGLDVDTLPEHISDLGADAKLAVMNSFDVALGMDCTGCHASSGGVTDYTASTPEMAVATKMWTNYVWNMEKTDGSYIYCDNCHDGKLKYLERGDHGSLVSYMKTDLTAQLGTIDGTANTCATCHGTPFAASFLDTWRN